MDAKVQCIQHLGLVAGMCNEIDLADTIDNYLPDSKRKVSVGKSVQAMIINALGFSGRALYLTPYSYKNRPIEQLIGKGIAAEHLNDDCLGTALDTLYEYGVTELFYLVSSHALNEQGIDHSFVHLDSTTFSLHGEYDQENKDERVVTITKGLSKDHAPELNQVILSMMCSHKSTLPVWLEVLSGNVSDKKSFRKSILQFKEQFNGKKLPYFVADSALYSKNLGELEGIKWVTRVPETIKEAKQHILTLEKDDMIDAGDGYFYSSVISAYGDIPQRWLLVFSQHAYDREIKTFDRNLEKTEKKKEKEIWHLSKIPFACEADAVKAAERFNKSLRFHTLEYQIKKHFHYVKKGRPSKDDIPTGESWFIIGTMNLNEQSIADAKKKKGIFIIATNETNQELLNDEALLEVYKAQGVSVERGFRFLKDPMFYAESLYLNSPKRIMALIMVMTLSLLIYSLTERKLRASLKEQNAYVPNQKGKPIQNPTIRWVFQMFEFISLFTYQKEGFPQTESSNIDQEHVTILECLGKSFKKMYFL